MRKLSKVMRVRTLVDKSKLKKYLLKRLVNASKARETSQMNVINEIIIELDKGHFDYNYKVLEKAVTNFDKYIEG